MFRNKKKSGLQFTKKVYYGESARKKKKAWKRKLNQGKLLADVYVISFASCEGNLFDIIPAYLLTKTDYPRDHVKILGIAVGKEEAYELLEQLIMKIYTETGAFRVKEFFD